MEIAGFPIDLLFLAQLGTTAIIVGLYAILTSLGERRADHQSDCQMLLLISFVMQEHASLKSLHSVLNYERGFSDEGFRKMNYFTDSLIEFERTGELPSLDGADKTTITENLLAILLSPLAAILVVPMLVDWHKKKIYRIRNTEIRKNYFSKMVLLAIGGIGYFLIGIGLFALVKWISLIFLVIAAITVAGAVAGVAVFTYEQQAWKAYWGDRLLEILAVQDHEKAHDQFNRALLLSSSLSEQPDVPFPGRLGLYTGIYSLTQALLLVVSNQLAGG